MAKKYKPFATSQQCREWLSRNCGTCKKGWEERHLRFRCEWERKLCAVSIYGDPISKETAQAIGFFDSSPIIEGCDLWECPGWERGRK